MPVKKSKGSKKVNAGKKTMNPDFLSRYHHGGKKISPKKAPLRAKGSKSRWSNSLKKI